jgi:hypothetical protein
MMKKILSPKNGKKIAILTQNICSYSCTNINMAIANYDRKLIKIVENSDHNIDPLFSAFPIGMFQQSVPPFKN